MTKVSSSDFSFFSRIMIYLPVYFKLSITVIIIVQYYAFLTIYALMYPHSTLDPASNLYVKVTLLPHSPSLNVHLTFIIENLF